MQPLCSLPFFLILATFASSPAFAQGFVCETLGWGCEEEKKEDPAPKKAATRPNLGTPIPRIRIESAPKTIKENEGPIVIMLYRSRTSAGEVPLLWELRSKTAELNKDYAIQSGEIIFKEREKNAAIEIPLIDDTEHEKPEEIIITLKEAGKTVRFKNGDTVKVTILDDDPLPKKIVQGFARFSKETIRFGSRKPGEEDIRTVTMANGGETSINLQEVIISEGRDDFTVIDKNGCAGSPVTPGARCRFEILFSPISETPVRRKGKISFFIDGKATTLPLHGATEQIADPVDPPPPAEPPRDYALEAAIAAREASMGTLRIRGKKKELVETPEKISITRKARKSEKKHIFTNPIDGTRMISRKWRIPCMTVDAIDTQLPGPVRCQVDTNVWCADGDKICLPKGTMAIGEYSPLAGEGSSRVDSAWTSFITPEHAEIIIKDGLTAVDKIGRVGLPAHVDNRWPEKFGSAVAVSALGAGLAYALTTKSENSSMEAAKEQVLEGTTRITTEILDKTVDLKPLGSVPKGTVFYIHLRQHLFFAQPGELVPLNADDLEKSKKTG